ncbi:MAG: cell envelope integrity protein CreD [Flavobacteriaceae bacterium]
METNQNPTSFFQSATARLIMVGLLTLILLIPLAIVNDLIHERAKRQKEVVSEITSKWGQEVFVYGPILKVPYTTYSENKIYNEQTKTMVTESQAIKNFAYFFPEQLTNQTEVTTQTKYRSNYEAVLFTAQMDFSGHYAKPDFSLKNIPDEDIEWNKATIVIQTSNLSSIKDVVSITLGKENYTFEPVYNRSDSDLNSLVSSLETSFIDFSEYFESGNFSFSINYQGSSKISIVPIGKTTEASMKSNWNAPKFDGNFLPSHDITDSGFSADWKVLHINRPFAQQSFGFLPNISEYSFDVDFIIPVDQYAQNDRASKYGFLIIGLTFLIFFLIQNISKIKIHIFQYTMIGLALIMFYTLLISITEHSSFLKAYLIAGISVVLLISLYSVSILKNKKFPMLIGLSLSALYGFIFVIIQLENYALLVGSIGLFLILATVMFISRKIDFSS